jgi:hypothetical protein
MRPAILPTNSLVASRYMLRRYTDETVSWLGQTASGPSGRLTASGQGLPTAAWNSGSRRGLEMTTLGQQRLDGDPLSWWAPTCSRQPQTIRQPTSDALPTKQPERAVRTLTPDSIVHPQPSEGS